VRLAHNFPLQAPEYLTEEWERSAVGYIGKEGGRLVWCIGIDTCDWRRSPGERFAGSPGVKPHGASEFRFFCSAGHSSRV
jgi:hypothetical protein